MSRFVAAVMTSPGGDGHDGSQLSVKWTSKDALAGSANRDGSPAPHAVTGRSGRRRGATAKRVRVERGIYRQPNGKYSVCFMRDGRPCFRTVGDDLELAASSARRSPEPASYGVLACAPRLSFAKLAGWWLERSVEILHWIADV